MVKDFPDSEPALLDLRRAARARSVSICDRSGIDQRAARDERRHSSVHERWEDRASGHGQRRGRREGGGSGGRGARVSHADATQRGRSGGVGVWRERPAPRWGAGGDPGDWRGDASPARVAPRPWSGPCGSS